MWVSLIRPHIDYCSQLWAPQEGPLLDKIEKLQYDFTKLAPSVRNLEYQDRLKEFRLNSLQRRFERYKIFYIFKIHKGLSPNCDIIQSTDNESRLGLKFWVPWCSNSKEGTLKEQTFQVTGPQLWNTLPIFIRNYYCDTFLEFKEELDRYLTTIEDVPRLGSTLQRRNSLIDILC